jgi:hypothetical protein
MSVWKDKLQTPRYRVAPIIDDGDHFVIQLVDGYDLSCYREGKDTKHVGRSYDYCPFCGDEL